MRILLDFVSVGSLFLCMIEIFVIFSVGTSVCGSLMDSSDFLHGVYGLLKCSGIKALVVDYILLCVREKT